MASNLKHPLKREVLSSEAQAKTTELLQKNLVNLVDLALMLKQAHWNVLGPNFRSIHLQLDEIILTVRDSSDEVAERITTLGVAADGRSSTVAKETDLKDYPRDFQNVNETVTQVADALKITIDSIRASIEQLGDLDPISEDMAIGISAAFEKHLWMLQAQEPETVGK